MQESALSKVSSLGLNIDNMINKSRGDYAYSMLDVAGDVSHADIASLKNNENIIRIRVIK